MTNILYGIDVSNAQGAIRWNVVKTATQPITVSFAFCKATEGANYTDSRFHENWAGIKSCGIPRGCYEFARTSNNPIIEADYFINIVQATNDLNQGDMLVLDIETSNLVGNPFIQWVLDWCNRVESKTNITPIIYTGSFFTTHSVGTSPDLMKQIARFPLWEAAYVQFPNSYIPIEWKDIGWRFWQKSGDQAAHGDTVLQLPGIHGNVDKDVFIGTPEELQTFVNISMNTRKL